MSGVSFIKVGQTIDELKQENQRLRDLLWMWHDRTHVVYLYGDDGERQCSRCMVDFKRDTPEQIMQRVERQRRLEVENEG